MFFRNKKDMNFCHRMYVIKRYNIFILVFEFLRNFLFNNFAKNTILHKCFSNNNNSNYFPCPVIFDIKPLILPSFSSTMGEVGKSRTSPSINDSKRYLSGFPSNSALLEKSYASATWEPVITIVSSMGFLVLLCRSMTLAFF